MLNTILNAIENTRQTGNTTGLITLLDQGYLVVRTEHQKRTLQEFVRSLNSVKKEPLSLNPSRIVTVEDVNSGFMRGTRLPLFFDNFAIYSVLSDASHRMEGAEEHIGLLYRQIEEKDSMLVDREQVIKDRDKVIAKLIVELTSLKIEIEKLQNTNKELSDLIADLNPAWGRDDGL